MTCWSSAVFVRIALPVVLILAGCSSSKKGFTVKGSVSYQGKPLSAGIVRLHMADNRMAMAMINPDGSFEATNVFPGEAKVTVEENMGAKMRRMMPPSGGPQAPEPNPASASPPPIPDKYKNVSTTDLVFSLQTGTPLNIELH